MIVIVVDVIVAVTAVVVVVVLVVVLLVVVSKITLAFTSCITRRVQTESFISHSSAFKTNPIKILVTAVSTNDRTRASSKHLKQNA